MGNMITFGMERELKTQPRIFSWSRRRYSIPKPLTEQTLYVCDPSVTMKDGECTISLMPQGVQLKFKAVLAGDDVSFTLVNEYPSPRLHHTVEVMSDQILMPLCKILGILPDNAILHMFRQDEMHLRILKQQLCKVWLVDSGSLHLFTVDTDADKWRLMITDHNNWSTGHL